jgi:predicted secreted Zn-dependent protease
MRLQLRRSTRYLLLIAPLVSALACGGLPDARSPSDSPPSSPPTDATLATPADDRPAGPREVPADVTVREFVVTGADAAALRASIDVHGPVWTDGKHYDALTHADWKWKGNWDAVRSTCQITSLDITFTAVIDFPRWDTPSDADPKLVDQWRTFTDRLWQHELEHVQIGRDAAQDAEATLRAIHAPRCDRMPRLMDAATERLDAEHEAADAAYDRRTRHGETEGVRFP